MMFSLILDANFFLMYMVWAGRGVSICTACFPSVFQAVTISPMNSKWAELKLKAPKYFIPSTFLYWLLQMLGSPDVFCFMLMLWASGSMVFLLYRHKQRAQHIHRIPVSSQSSPESRATQTLLLLVSTFVFLNLLSCIFHIVLAVFSRLTASLRPIANRHWVGLRVRTKETRTRQGVGRPMIAGLPL
ncbi:LOW QUALITY PROTEIN: vomeronasal type-1 receptor 4-like [Rhynchonycteris naso]